MLVSTHLIDEVADLLERVVMIGRGRIVLDVAADELRGSASTVSGPNAAVEEFVAGRRWPPCSAPREGWDDRTRCGARAGPRKPPPP